jgi:acyl dehydratase
MDKDAVGKEIGPFSYVTWERKIRQFVEATEDKNPLYVDEEFARRSKHKGNIVPPAMANAYFVGMPIWSVIEVCKIDRARGLHAEQEYEFIKPVKPCTLLSTYYKIVDIYEKKGLNFAIIEGVTKDEEGDIVVKGKITLIER